MRFVLTLHRSHGAGPGGAAFLAAAGEAGELIGGYTLADPSLGVVVQLLHGATSVTGVPHPRPGTPATAQYMIDCENRERAVELAALLLGGGDGDVEVRPVMEAAGLEM
ncbi:hypothetical protein AB0K18_06470 [Nonomuraea sp. NPDC049421]|uniref:hypothetical protein n=1 Tax=Nonomuraea sp. NPDC049421 TaxID=3155275 RepID=UPI00344482D6